MLYITVIVILFECLFNPINSQTDDHSLSSLAQLPLEKLLHVKQALGSDSPSQILNREDNEDDFYIAVEDSNDELSGEALPLRENLFWYKEKKRNPDLDSAPFRRTDWKSHKSKKKGDLSKIFHSTITILSFLAFGGYLLCMIITAVNNYKMGMMMTTPTPSAATIITGRRRRRKRSSVREKDSLDEFISTLHNIAEGYVKYSGNVH